MSKVFPAKNTESVLIGLQRTTPCTAPIQLTTLTYTASISHSEHQNNNKNFLLIMATDNDLISQVGICNTSTQKILYILPFKERSSIPVSKHDGVTENNTF